MNGRPLVSVIIPTNNRNDKLFNCLYSVYKNTYSHIEVIVVNDAPNNDLRKKLKGFNLRLLQNKKNMLPSYCRNRGAAVSKGEIIFFLDDDNVLDKHCISELVSHYSTSIGLIGPLMYRKDGSKWFYGAKNNWINPNAKLIMPSEAKRVLVETDVIPNAYMVSREKYNKVGGEDTRLFPTQHEELDLAKKLQLLGYRHFICTKARTIHDYGELSGHITPKQLYFIARNNILIEKKYAPKARLVAFYLVYLTAQFLYYIVIFIPLHRGERRKLLINYLRGIHDGINSGV